MTSPRYPAVYQINTRVWLTHLSRARGYPVTLGDIPESELDAFARYGFEWIWLMGVWQTGPVGREISRTHAEWRREFVQTLPDLTDADICGSCFAVTGYTVDQRLGGNAALQLLRQRLHPRGLRLLLDFIPNHTAIDHPWVYTRPDFYVHGTEADLARAPQDYIRVTTARGSLILAHGRDPYFPSWPDTLQLNYGNAALQQAMTAELLQIASLCDGVRCDMAMLVLPQVFQRTWGIATEPFWPRAIQRVRRQAPHFLFVAEVYWDLEWELQQQGFDYTYDKTLYDRLRSQQARAVRDHLTADLDFQNKLLRFLENHDEPRAAAVFPPDVHRAAAIITFLVPGLRFFHHGQLEGWKTRISPHLCRGPVEATDPSIADFYTRLLSCLSRVREGDWQLLPCRPAWDGNWTWDCFLAAAWQGPQHHRLLVAVNYASHRSQCYVQLPFQDMGGAWWQLQDMMGTASYDREGDDLLARGLYLDLPAWGYHVFDLRRSG
ncbi:MAG: alpha-amylase family glycosyl hydrolase [Candidatus Binatia bacterium]|nr:alpha-amylase family glycosyl hydrolase [Candidatus Binatia bacterium]